MLRMAWWRPSRSLAIKTSRSRARRTKAKIQAVLPGTMPMGRRRRAAMRENPRSRGVPTATRSQTPRRRKSNGWRTGSPLWTVPLPPRKARPRLPGPLLRPSQSKNISVTYLALPPPNSNKQVSQVWRYPSISRNHIIRPLPFAISNRSGIYSSCPT